MVAGKMPHVLFYLPGKKAIGLLTNACEMLLNIIMLVFTGGLRPRRVSDLEGGELS